MTAGTMDMGRSQVEELTGKSAFGHWIARTIAGMGLSMRGAASKIGMHPASLQTVLASPNPPKYETVAHLSRLGVTPAQMSRIIFEEDLGVPFGDAAVSASPNLTPDEAEVYESLSGDELRLMLGFIRDYRRLHKL